MDVLTRIQRNVKKRCGGHAHKRTFLVHRSPPCCPRALTRTPGGLAGVRSISAHIACPLWPMTFWRMCPCPGSPGPSTYSAVLVISSIMPSGVGFALLLPTWTSRDIKAPVLKEQGAPTGLHQTQDFLLRAISDRQLGVLQGDTKRKCILWTSHRWKKSHYSFLFC